MFIPGILSDGSFWQHQSRLLSGLADCSSVEWSLESSLAAMAETVLSSASYLPGSPKQVSLVGYSIGGQVALEVYRLKPQRVARIALLNAPTGNPSNEEIEWLNALLKLPFPAALPIPWQPHVERMRGMAQKWLQPTIQPDRFADTAFLYPAIDKIARCSRQMVLAQYEAMLLRGDRSSVLEGIRCPVLLLTGREDTRCPPLRYAEMAAKIPGCSLIVVPDCSHMSPLERPEAVAEALRDWLLASTIKV